MIDDNNDDNDDDNNDIDIYRKVNEPIQLATVLELYGSVLSAIHKKENDEVRNYSFPSFNLIIIIITR